jgi:SH3-like domain-containing protein
VEKGLKFRVAARDKNWVQVIDPDTSANGWIYSRFLKPTTPPAQ